MKSPKLILANLPVGSGGYNSNLNVYRVPITDLTLARNVRFDNRGVYKAPGMRALGTAISGADVCLGAASYFPNAASEVGLTAWDDGHIYKEASDNFGSVDLGSFGATAEPVVMVPFSNLAESGSTVANRMAFFSAGTAPKTVVGTGGTYTAFTAVSADWASANNPAGGCLHDFRLCAYGVADYPHNIYFSTLTDLTNFTGSGSKVMSVYPGEGQKIVAAISYLETNLVVFKYPVGIYAVDTSDLTAPVNPAYRVTDAIGGAGPNAVCKVNGDIWFISDQGRIHSLEQLRGDIDPKQSDITHQLNLTEFVKRNVDLTKIKWARLYFDPLRQEVIYTFRSTVATDDCNDTAIIIRLPSSNQPPLVSIDRRGDKYQAVWGRRVNSTGANEVLCAGTGGQVYTFNESNYYTIDGTGAYQGAFSHPITDFAYMDPRLGGLEKQFKFLQLQLLPTTTESTLFIDIYVDNEFKRTESVLLLSSGNSVFDTATYDSATFATEGEVFYRTIPLDVTGRKIQFVCYNNADEEAFAIADMTVSFEISDPNYEETA